MPETEPATPADPKEPKSVRRNLLAHPIKLLVLAIVLVAAVVGGLRYWDYLESYESTDDAQIDGDIYPITSRIAGTVKNIYVEDNAVVKAGQVLADLDPRDFDVAIEQARASLHESRTQVQAARPNIPITSVSTETTVSNAVSDIATARAQVAEAERDRDSDLANVRSAEADNAKAQSDLARYRELVAKDEISQQQFDQAEAAAKAAAANVEAKRALAEAASRNIEAMQARLEQSQTRQKEAERNRPQQIAIQGALVESRRAMTEVQQAQLDKAELNRSYTTIVSPIDGVVGKRSVANGEQVGAGQQLMVVVPLNGLWVTANFKETQLRRMHPGQRATIHVDAFDRDYEGYVLDVAGASGARFSLLPPENATGNYVKVVQRVPMRIQFKPGQDPNHLLREGMSVDPTVWIESNKPHFLQK